MRKKHNVFVDLGFPPGEAENLRLRAELMIVLTEEIRRRRLTQQRAAKLLGVTQPRVSDLMRGKIDLFSIDALISLASAAGFRVDVKIKRAAA